MKKHQKNSGSSDTPPKRPKLETDDGSQAGSSTAEVETEAQPSYQSENTGSNEQSILSATTSTISSGCFGLSI